MRRRVPVALVAILALAWGAPTEPPRAQGVVEVVATGVSRPLQLVWDGRFLVVLSPSARGDSAGEIHRVPVDTDVPTDLSRQARVRIPFADRAAATLGSLALDPASGDLFLGEENGTRIWRLTTDERLTLYATGLRRLAGGSTLVFDRVGRLVVVDYADPYLSSPDDRPPPGLDQLREEDYRGPLVFRLTLDPTLPLPRRVGKLSPLFPRAWGGRAGGGMLPHLISVAPLPHDEMLLLASNGELYRLSSDGGFGLFARLPRGQYNRINMVVAPDGVIFVSGGFHVGRVFRVAPDGGVSVVASGLADPAGIALDGRGALYVAESALHRIVRVRAQ
jgi:hypothetical protein